MSLLTFVLFIIHPVFTGTGPKQYEFNIEIVKKCRSTLNIAKLTKIYLRRYITADNVNNIKSQVVCSSSLEENIYQY